MNTLRDPITIDSNFPGGNIVVGRCEGSSVALHQDLRDTEVWWFYWHFRVRGAAGQRLSFHFTQGDVIGSQGPAISVDLGQSWRWLGRESVVGTSFTYSFAHDEDDVRFAFAPAYLEADLHRFLARWQYHEALQVHALCRTPKGRTAERLQLAWPGAPPKHRVLLTCRHHACESVASYVLEGLLNEVLAADAAWHEVEILAVPFVDKDGVEEGDQGKQRRPRDHNRDYEGASLYATTAALRELVPAWSDGKLRVALDLHCPGIRGDTAEVVYFVGGQDTRNWEEVQRFSAILERIATGPLPYYVADNLPFGAGWNTVENFTQGRSFAGWAATLSGVQMATSLEIPYATVRDLPVTPDSARALGQDLARALQRYLGVWV